MGETEVQGDVTASESGVASGRDILGGVNTAPKIGVQNNYYAVPSDQALQESRPYFRAPVRNDSPDTTIFPQLVEVQRPLVERLARCQAELRSYIEATLAATDLASESDVAIGSLKWRIDMLTNTPDAYRVNDEEWREIENHLGNVSGLINGFQNIKEVKDAMRSLSEAIEASFSQVSSGRSQPHTEHLAILKNAADSIDRTLRTAKDAYKTCRTRARQILDDVKDDVVRILEVADMAARLGAAGQVHAAVPQEPQVRAVGRPNLGEPMGNERVTNQSNTEGGPS